MYPKAGFLTPAFFVSNKRHFFIFIINMLNYTIGDTTEEDIILTLNENQTTTEPIYVFEFKHVLTKTEINFTKTTSDDKSFWPERYNLFKIKPGELFTEPGEWHYKITEQQTGEILEQGMLLMQKAITFNYTTYNAGTKFTAYKG